MVSKVVVDLSIHPHLIRVFFARKRLVAREGISIPQQLVLH
jgi:hypothetical protein